MRRAGPSQSIFLSNALLPIARRSIGWFRSKPFRPPMYSFSLSNSTGCRFSMLFRRIRCFVIRRTLFPPNPKGRLCLAPAIPAWKRPGYDTLLAGRSFGPTPIASLAGVWTYRFPWGWQGVRWLSVRQIPPVPCFRAEARGRASRRA